MLDLARAASFRILLMKPPALAEKTKFPQILQHLAALK
jgi:hypothetical protein